MFADINLLAVLGATVASFALGALWHSRLLFGDYWMRLMGLTQESIASMRLSGTQAMALGFVVQLVFTYVLALIMGAIVIIDVSEALTFAFLVWLGFIATTMAGGFLWENKSLKLVVFNLLYPLASTALAAVILALWQ